MTRDEALQLAREIASGYGSVRDYAARNRRNTSTVMSLAFRAGVNLGTEVRRERIAIVARLKAAGMTTERAAMTAGFSTPQSYYRAKRSPMLHREASCVASR